MPTIIPRPLFHAPAAVELYRYLLRGMCRWSVTYQYNNFSLCVSYRSWIRVEHQETTSNCLADQMP